MKKEQEKQEQQKISWVKNYGFEEDDCSLKKFKTVGWRNSSAFEEGFEEDDSRLKG